MAKALVISLGIGQTVESGLTQSIKLNNPDYIVFLASSKSRATLDRELLKSELSRRRYEVKEVENEEDAERCYTTSKNIIKELKKKGYDEICVDFTSGTKAMTGGLILAAVIEDAANLVYVAGERDNNGRVISGAERIHATPSPADILIDLKKKTIVDMFNNYQFYDCLRIIDELEKYPQTKLESHNIPAVKKISEIYYDWDRFRHKDAQRKMKESSGILESVVCDVKQLDSNKEFLGKLVNTKDQTLYLADLIANAKRRIEEGKFDDAVARLYRATELIGQITARNTLGVNVDNLKLSDLPQSLREKYKKYAKEEELKLGLYSIYELLYDYSNEIGKRFVEDKELKNYLTKRNMSILAHGLYTVNDEEANAFCRKVLEYAKLVKEDILQWIAKAEFTKIEA
ncbi:MAG: TIGR02710 family CRISPR-associated CARF protein [Nitrososphaerales archaeon]